MIDCPRVLIAGTQSGVGKTSVSLAVMASLSRAGYRVQAFKVGPDYIDPSYHRVATERPSHNLDSWLLTKETVQWLFQSKAGQADISVIEGVMGLYDGIDGKNETSSTAQMAKWLKAPVLLVVDAGGMSRSVAAMVKGYQEFDPELRLSGVILNRVGSAGHFALLKEAIEHYTKLPVVGALFKNQKAQIPERHLGLMTASENKELKSCLDSLVKIAQPNPNENLPGIDLSLVLKIAKEAPALNPIPESSIFEEKSKALHKVRIGIAQDPAFSFYYQANLDLLSECGAELVSFSPLSDDKLPENCGALYFGGGFPEFFVKELEENKTLKIQVKQRIEEGMPVYAECGGLMYLSDWIETLDGKSHAMVGAVPGKIRMTQRLQNFGYKQGRMLTDTVLGRKNDPVRGHEFHYSQRIPGETIGDPSVFPYELTDKKGEEKQVEGYVKGKLVAAYLHLHFLSNPEWAKTFVKIAQNHLQNRKEAAL